MNNAPHTTTPDATRAFEAQGPIEPGTPGYWKVWGAKVHNIRIGDLILTKDEADNFRYDLIADTFEAKAGMIRKGLVNAEGDRFTLGALNPVIVLRWDTHNLLA